MAADQAKYIWTSEQIFQLLKGYDLPLNYASIDEFQIDLGNHPNPVSLGKGFKEQIYANFNITKIDYSNFEQVLRKAPLGFIPELTGIF